MDAVVDHEHGSPVGLVRLLDHRRDDRHALAGALAGPHEHATAEVEDVGPLAQQRLAQREDVLDSAAQHVPLRRGQPLGVERGLEAQLGALVDDRPSVPAQPHGGELGEQLGLPERLNREYVHRR